LLGGSEIWVRVKMFVESCPNSSYTVAQFGRSNSAATTPIFSIRAKSNLKNMVAVQGGALPTGSSLAGQTVETFHIGKYEVTWGEWKTVRAWAAANGYDIGTTGQGTADDHPVRDVNWYDVLKWCNAKSEMEGLIPVYHVYGDVIFPNAPRNIYRSGSWDTSQGIPLTGVAILPAANGYRLPLEKEWEWAGRGGLSSKGYTFSGSNDVNAVAWYALNSNGATKVIGTKAANELGIYDMSGNVWEWCWDMDGFSSRRIRSGSWYDGGVFSPVGVGDHYTSAPQHRGNTIGFRLARNAQ